MTALRLGRLVRCGKINYATKVDALLAMARQEGRVDMTPDTARAEVREQIAQVIFDTVQQEQHDDTAWTAPIIEESTRESYRREADAILAFVQREQEIVDAVMYGMRVGAFPCPEPSPGATADELIRWGAIRNLHAKVATRAERSSQE